MLNSYLCTANLERIIKARNQKILNIDTQICQCNWACNLIRGNCRSKNIIYKETFNSDLEKKLYIGLCLT